MSQSQVVSFRASGHFLNWIEAQRLEGESPSQAAMRILKGLSVDKFVDTSTALSTNLSTDLSTRSIDSFVSTNLSTEINKIVDIQVAAKLDPVIERLAALEERPGKSIA